MKAVISVIGKDKVGILAAVSNKCAQYGANIIEVTQSVLQEMFCMIMLVDIDKITVSLSDFSKELDEMGEKMNVSVHCMHEDIFNSMHRI
ncbi:MAG: ACT domain-containing protein [Acutalibacteraceae bacterium]